MLEEPTYFEFPDAFRRWLDTHHDTSQELWVGYYKKATEQPLERGQSGTCAGADRHAPDAPGRIGHLHRAQPGEVRAVLVREAPRELPPELLKRLKANKAA